MSAPKLFSPGPVMVKENVRQALTHYDICHRGAEFEDLFARTTAKINKLFKADDSYRSVISFGIREHRQTKQFFRRSSMKAKR